MSHKSYMLCISIDSESIKIGGKEIFPLRTYRKSFNATLCIKLNKICVFASKMAPPASEGENIVTKPEKTEHKNIKLVREYGKDKYGCKTHGDDNLIEDHCSGDVICKSCGVVIESRMISDSAEWRNFADDSQMEKWSKSRTGDAEKPFLSADYNLGTIIKSFEKNLKNVSSFNGSIMNQFNRRSVDKALTYAFKEIDIMGDRINLPNSVLYRAKSLYNQLYRHIKLKGNILHVDSKMAACLFIACEMEECSRSKREIAAIYDVRKTTLSNAINRARKSLALEAINTSSVEMIDRYCSYLTCSKPERKRALLIARQLEMQTQHLKKKTKTLPLEAIAASSIYLAIITTQGMRHSNR